MLQQIIMYAVLLIAAIGAIVGWSNSKKGANWGQPMTVVCAIIAIGMGLWLSYYNTFSNADQKRAQEREKAYTRAKVKIIAKKVKELLPGKKAVVLIDPEINIADNEEMKMWKEEFGLSDDDFIKPEKPQPPKGTNPEEFMPGPINEWFNEAKFKKSLEGKTFDILIMTVALPTVGITNAIDLNAGTPKAAYLKDKHLVFASSDLNYCAMMIKSGFAPVALAPSKNAVFDDKPAPKDEQAAFDKRFTLVTKDNIDSMIKENPELFGIQPKK